MSTTPGQPAGRRAHQPDTQPDARPDAQLEDGRGKQSPAAPVIPLRRDSGEPPSPQGPSSASTAAASTAPARNGRARWARGPARPTLAEAFDPRSNALDLLRLALATTVAVVHTMLIGTGHQPQTGSTDLGSLAVDAFFVLSGFLVARSYLRLDSLRRFVWHRALRILPGFWLSLLLTAALVAPLLALLEGRPAASVFTGPDSALDYLQHNAFLQIQQFGISGLTAGSGAPDVINGSLWTLLFEACCYAIVASLGVVGILRRQRWLVLALLIALWLLTIAAAAGFNPLGSELMLRLSFVFLLGTAGHLFADQIPVRGWLAGFSLALVIVGLTFLPDYRALAGPAFAYLCLWAIVRCPWRPRMRWDLSYGMYVWHWPIAQLLFALGAATLTAVPFIALGLALTAAVATASWTLIERPALSWKDAAWVTRTPRALRPRP
ncbi:acyltransferase family protein [Kineococcus sp. SYSU DK003]|uniref:acyltransferase family protein n=1 Tax=Kineococcus sp. SYSU DK003 TaxID=3383124 RepID=UPI003D7D8FFE